MNGRGIKYTSDLARFPRVIDTKDGQIPVFPVLHWRRCFTTDNFLHESHKMSPFVGVPLEREMQRPGSLHGLFPVIRHGWFQGAERQWSYPVTVCVFVKLGVHYFQELSVFD